MTTDLIELSKQAAEVLGVPAFRNIVTHHGDDVWGREELYLAQDHARCAEIAADKRINIEHYDSSIHSVWHVEGKLLERFLFVNLADHNNNRLEAYCVAVCKTVLEQAKQS